MALDRQRERQASMMVIWAELPRSPGHVFYQPVDEARVQANGVA